MRGPCPAFCLSVLTKGGVGLKVKQTAFCLGVKKNKIKEEHSPSRVLFSASLRALSPVHRSMKTMNRSFSWTQDPRRSLGHDQWSCPSLRKILLRWASLPPEIKVRRDSPTAQEMSMLGGNLGTEGGALAPYLRLCVLSCFSHLFATQGLWPPGLLCPWDARQNTG